MFSLLPLTASPVLLASSVSYVPNRLISGPPCNRYSHLSLHLHRLLLKGPSLVTLPTCRVPLHVFSSLCQRMNSRASLPSYSASAWHFKRKTKVLTLSCETLWVSPAVLLTSFPANFCLIW